MELEPLSETRDELYYPDARNQLIIAAAGSGKTYTLVETLAERINNGTVDPRDEGEEIIVFTFTNNAAEELIVRLSDRLDDDEEVLNEIFIGTIHSWCNQYLDTNANLANTKILDELERSQLIQRISGFLELEDVYDSDYFFRQVERFENDVEFFYNENLAIDDHIIPDDVRPALRRYIDFLEEQRLIDFGALIRRTINHIHNADTDPEKQYHLFVDEYQDVNPAQVDLIQAITDAYPTSTVFAVGDPRQAIYQWRGGDINRILEFDQDFDDVEAYTLTTNRRSRTGIIEFSNLISNDMDISQIDLSGMQPFEDRADDDISVIGDLQSTDHGAAVVNEIQRLHNQGVDYDDMAVLMRSVDSDYGQALMDRLRDEGIPFYSPNRNAGTDFVEDVAFSIIDVIELIDEMEDRVAKTPQEEQEILQEIEDNCSDIAAYCTDTSWSDVHYAIGLWHEDLTDGGPDYDNDQYNFRRQFFEFCDEINLKIHPSDTDLQEGFSGVTQIMKSIEEVYRRRFQGRGNVRSSPLYVFLNNFRWHLEHKLERWAETGMDVIEEDAVTVSTVHAAKGLQWPVVFVPKLVKGRFPVRRRPHETSFPDAVADRYGTDTEDEKRLWYVAATRARDRLYFYAADEDGVAGPFSYDSHLREMERGATTTQLPSSDVLSVIEPEDDDELYIHTGLSSFLLLLECPYHFYMRHVVGVNPPVSEQFGAGNVLHRTIERALEESESVDLDEITRQEVYLPLADIGDEKRVQNSIKSKVRNLIDMGGLEGVEFAEHPFSVKMNSLVVSGIVDALRRTNGSYQVIDWKTSIHEEFQFRYENQIKLYVLALRRLGQDIDGGLIANLSEDDPIEEGRVVDVSSRTTEDLLLDAQTRVDQLLGSGPYTTPSEQACGACDLNEICPHSEI